MRKKPLLGKAAKRPPVKPKSIEVLSYGCLNLEKQGEIVGFSSADVLNGSKCC